MARAERIPQIETRAVTTDDELRRANDLMARSHTPNFFQASHWFDTAGAGYPGFMREHTRVALYNGQLAGALRLNTDTLRLGEARLKMGGLGWVTTHPNFRKLGICSSLMADTIRYMREHGYHVSMLFGIPNFYHRFDYVSSLADYAVLINTRDVAHVAGGGLRVRDAKPTDIPAIQKLHNADDGAVACSIVRTAGHVAIRWDDFRPVHVLTTAEGKVVAYLRTKEEKTHLAIHEAGALEADLYRDLVALARSLAQEACVGELKFLVPPEHPFAHHLMQYNSTHETRLIHEQGGMMTFVNLTETLESLLPEWERLLARSVLAETRCEVTLVVDGRAIRVRANRGAVDVSEHAGQNKCSVGSTHLMQMVTGFCHPDDVLQAERRLMNEESRQLVRTLMPKRNPYVWSFDHF